MPLIFAIHGGSGPPEGMINIANFKPISDREKVVLIYPAGIQNNWNDGRPTTPNQLGINDVSFFNQMSFIWEVDARHFFYLFICNGSSDKDIS